MSLQSLSAQYKSLFFPINSPVLGSAIGKPVLEKYFKNLPIQFKFNSNSVLIPNSISNLNSHAIFSKRFKKFPKSKQTHSLTNSVQDIWRFRKGETNCNVVVFLKENNIMIIINLFLWQQNHVHEDELYGDGHELFPYLHSLLEPFEQ